MSIALYGYDGRLYVGIDSDGTAMPDVDAPFRAMLRASFRRGGGGRPRPGLAPPPP